MENPVPLEELPQQLEAKASEAIKAHQLGLASQILSGAQAVTQWLRNGRSDPFPLDPANLQTWGIVLETPASAAPVPPTHPNPITLPILDLAGADRAASVNVLR